MDISYNKKVNLGFVGVGGRGQGLLKECLDMKDISVPAICDLSEKNRWIAQDMVEKSKLKRPESYANYKDLLSRDDIDGIIIATGWVPHLEIAMEAMENGVYAATEVGAANSIEECWQLVRTYEETKTPCMILENYCFMRDVMAVLNMVRKGVLGEILHCECGYQHELQERLVLGKGTGLEEKGSGDYRTVQNEKRNADIYPTHGIGPMSKILNINAGNRFLTLTSTASKARGLRDWAQNNLEKDHPAAKKDWNIGDVITTVIKCYNGETIIIKHITTIPCPFSRLGRVQGTKGVWLEDNKSIYIEGQSPHHEWEPFDKYQTDYEHPLWRKYLDEGVESGHGGGDYLALRAFIESIKKGTNPPIDVYDTASWMAITPLSEQSISLGSHPVSFPDFTSGHWMTRESGFNNDMVHLIFDEDIDY